MPDVRGTGTICILLISRIADAVIARYVSETLFPRAVIAKIPLRSVSPKRIVTLALSNVTARPSVMEYRSSIKNVASLLDWSVKPLDIAEEASTISVKLTVSSPLLRSRMKLTASGPVVSRMIEETGIADESGTSFR